MSQVNVDNVIGAIIAFRDKRSALKKEFDAADAVLKDKIEKLDTWLMAKMKETGSTQLGSPNGTAYQQTRFKGSCSDWPSLWEFLADHRRFDMIEKRISIKAVQEYYEEVGELPPGVNVSPELVINVRRA